MSMLHVSYSCSIFHELYCLRRVLYFLVRTCMLCSRLYIFTQTNYSSVYIYDVSVCVDKSVSTHQHMYVVILYGDLYAPEMMFARVAAVHAICTRFPHEFHMVFIWLLLPVLVSLSMQPYTTTYIYIHGKRALQSEPYIYTYMYI